MTATVRAFIDGSAWCRLGAQVDGNRDVLGIGLVPHAEAPLAAHVLLCEVGESQVGQVRPAVVVELAT